MKEFSDWINSPEGIAWEEGVYKDAFEEGFENGIHFARLDYPDTEIPTPDTPVFDPEEDFLSER